MFFYRSIKFYSAMVLFPRKVKGHKVYNFKLAKSGFHEVNGPMFTKSLLRKKRGSDRDLAYVPHQLPGGGLVARCANHKRCGGTISLPAVVDPEQRVTILHERPHKPGERERCLKASRALVNYRKNWSRVDDLILEEAEACVRARETAVPSFYAKIKAMSPWEGKPTKKRCSEEARAICSYLVDCYMAFGYYGFEPDAEPTQSQVLLPQPTNNLLGELLAAEGIGADWDGEDEGTSRPPTPDIRYEESP